MRATISRVNGVRRLFFRDDNGGHYSRPLRVFIAKYFFSGLAVNDLSYFCGGAFGVLTLTLHGLFSRRFRDALKDVVSYLVTARAVHCRRRILRGAR